MLHAGRSAPEPQLPTDQGGAPETRVVDGRHVTLRSDPLEKAQPSLRPVRELCWQAEGLHLRLTAQGPWRLDDLLTIVASIGASAAAP